MMPVQQCEAMGEAVSLIRKDALVKQGVSSIKASRPHAQIGVVVSFHFHATTPHFFGLSLHYGPSYGYGARHMKHIGLLSVLQHTPF